MIMWRSNTNNINKDLPTDLYHTAAILHKSKTFCPSSPAVKNWRTSLDMQTQSFLFSGESAWMPCDKDVLLDNIAKCLRGNLAI